MQKYKIEGNINFFEELNKSLEVDSDEEDNLESPNVCQITGMPLIDKCVKLNCGHSFNYDAIYTEICKQKFDFHTYSVEQLSFAERKKIRDLGINYFIRCPYCRNIQSELLPYYEELGFFKKYGVNTTDKAYLVYDATRHLSCTSTYVCYGYTFIKGICSAVSLVDDKTIPCYNSWVTELSGTGKNYCPRHIRTYTKNYKFAERQKKKTEKQELKAQKEALKQSIKNNKKKATNNVVSQENTVNEFIPEEEKDQDEVNTCIRLLITGPRKGLPCNVKSFKDCLCKRHYKPIDDQKSIDEVK